MVFHIMYLLKSMHGFLHQFQQKPEHANHRNARIEYLPQELCNKRIQMQEEDSSWYQQIRDVLYDKLHFDRIGKKSDASRKIYDCWAPYDTNCRRL